MTGKAILLNKQIWLALGMITFIGAVVASGTGAFFSDTADVTGNTFAAGTLDLQLTQNQGGGSPADTQSALWDFDNMAPGATPVTSSVWLRNSGSVDGATLGVSIPGGWINPSNIAAQMRITEMTLDGNNLLEGGAGATIPEYEAPTNCTTTVNPGGLVAAVTGAASGDVVCVDSGSYSPGTLTITQDNLTFVGLNDPTSGDKATINGEIVVDADGVTVRGLEITNPGGTFGVRAQATDNVSVVDNVFVDIGTTLANGSVQAIYYNAGSGAPHAAAGLNFSNNRFNNLGNTSMLPPGSGSSAKAIYIGDTTGTGVIDDVTISNNIIDGVFVSGNTFSNGGRGAYGFLVNFGGNTTNLVVENNSIENLSGWWSTAIGLEGRTQGAEVTLNTIGVLGSTSGGDTGVNVESNISGASIAVNQNNFDNSMNGVIINPNFTSFTGTIDATNNWWGDFDPSDNIFENNGTIDTTNFAGGPFAGLVNGTDTNGNGYADLRDLRDSAITGITPGLDAYDGANDQEFVMSVQLDGPTTGNTFQGLSLDDVTIEFSLNQI